MGAFASLMRVPSGAGDEICAGAAALQRLQARVEELEHALSTLHADTRFSESELRNLYGSGFEAAAPRLREADENGDGLSVKEIMIARARGRRS